MTQHNSHITTYLDYYCNLPDAPGFAVLLKGKWGSGKTWFIKRYCEKLKQQNLKNQKPKPWYANLYRKLRRKNLLKEQKQKCLYVSLNGVNSLSEIDNAFFLQLFPALSSKAIALVGNILAQIIKGTLKVDFNHDGRDDGTISKYPSLRLYDPFPSVVWWQTFFDKGSLDLQELNQSLASSIYFQDENTPKWMKLWHFHHLSDDEFIILLNEVDTQYLNRDAEFSDPGILKHVTGMFLNFSDMGLYSKTKEEILNSSKLYIDWLKNNNQSKLVSYSVSTADSIFGGYMGLGFQGAKLQEFQDFCTYLEKAQESTKVEMLPNLGRELLAIMQSDKWKFHDIISLNNSHDWGVPGLRYAEIPILKDIKTSEFVESFLQLKFDHQMTIGSALKERYKFDGNNEKLLEELDWLKSVRDLLLDEVARRKGKPSGHSIQVIIELDLNEAIQKLEATAQRLQQSQNNIVVGN